jgi:hypothetical protein
MIARVLPVASKITAARMLTNKGVFIATSLSVDTLIAPGRGGSREVSKRAPVDSLESLVARFNQFERI